MPGINWKNVKATAAFLLAVPGAIISGFTVGRSSLVPPISSHGSTSAVVSQEDTSKLGENPLSAPPPTLTQLEDVIHEYIIILNEQRTKPSNSVWIQIINSPDLSANPKIKQASDNRISIDLSNGEIKFGDVNITKLEVFILSQIGFLATIGLIGYQISKHQEGKKIWNELAPIFYEFVNYMNITKNENSLHTINLIYLPSSSYPDTSDSDQDFLTKKKDECREKIVKLAETETNLVVVDALADLYKKMLIEKVICAKVQKGDDGADDEYETLIMEFYQWKAHTINDLKPNMLEQTKKSM